MFSFMLELLSALNLLLSQFCLIEFIEVCFLNTFIGRKQFPASVALILATNNTLSFSAAVTIF